MKKRSALLAGLDPDNIIQSDNESSPFRPSIPTSSYKTRRQVHGSSKSKLCYSQKYHPMDDFTQPKRAAKMRVRYRDEPPHSELSLSLNDSGDEVESESESDPESAEETDMETSNDIAGHHGLSGEPIGIFGGIGVFDGHRSQPHERIHKPFRIHEDYDAWPARKGKRFFIHAEPLEIQLKAENATVAPVEYEDDDKENYPPDELVEPEDPHAGIVVHSAADIRRSGQVFDQENNDEFQQYARVNDMDSDGWDSVLGHISPLDTHGDGAGGETQQAGPVFTNLRALTVVGPGLSGSDAETHEVGHSFVIYEDQVESGQEGTDETADSTEPQAADAPIIE